MSIHVDTNRPNVCEGISSEFQFQKNQSNLYIVDVIDNVIRELKPMRERAAPFEEDPTLVRNILADGCEKARDIAEETMRDVREAMGLNFA